MTLLKHYLSREILANTLLVVIGLLAMFCFFDLIQELDNIGKGNYNLGTALLYVLLSAPGHVYEITPVAVLLGTTYALAQLAHHSELVVMRTSGLSVLAIGLALMRIGLVFTLATFLVGELVAPVSEKTAQKIRLQATEKVVAQEFRSGLWVKDDRSVVNIEEVLPDTSLRNIHIYEFDHDFRLRTISNASSGIFENNLWKLQNITQTQFFDQKIQTTHFDRAHWKSVIQPELLNVLLVVPEKMAAWNLYSYIKHLSENQQKTTRHEIALWSKMFYPTACLVMMIIALPIGFLHQRSGGISKKVLTGIMIGLGYQIVNRIFMHMGLLNDWPPLASATAPTLLFLSGGMWMLSQMEKR